MWIFSLFLLVIAIAVPYSVTAVVGSTGNVRHRRTRLKGMFRIALIVYAALVVLTFGAAVRSDISTNLKMLLFTSFFWGIPLASSGLAVFVYWGREAADESNLGPGISRP